TLTNVVRMGSPSVAGITKAVTPTTANLFMSQIRLSVNTSAAAGNIAGLRTTITPFWRGNAAGLGGFYLVFRFGQSIVAAQGRCFVGLTTSTAALGNANPLSFVSNTIGFGWDSGTTNVYAISSNATVAVNTTTSSSFPTTTAQTDWYEGVIFAPPNGGTVSYQLTNLTTGAVAIGDYNQINL